MISPSEVAKRIENELKERGIKKGEFLTGIGLGVNFLSQMGKSRDINVSSLILFADSLGCSVDYFLGRTMVPELNLYSDSSMSDEEKELIGYFRKLGRIDRLQVLSTAGSAARAAEKGTGEAGEGRFA